MWWIVWLIPFAVFLALLACCKMSGDVSRKEEESEK